MNTTQSFIEKKMHKFPIVAVFLTQLFVLFGLRNVFVLFHVSISPWMFVLAQSLICAFVIKKLLKLPHWLATISLLIPLCFFFALNFLPQSSTMYGVGFAFLALTFSHTLKERVPLYLTNPTTADALKKILRERNAHKVIDLGSGMGGVVRAMAGDQMHSHGVETAPMLWLVSNLLCLLTGRGKIFRKNIRQTDLSSYDVVYAFLSPAIMEELWEKVQREMKPGSVFISNSFVVPQIKASEILTLTDARKTQLLLYKI